MGTGRYLPALFFVVQEVREVERRPDDCMVPLKKVEVGGKEGWFSHSLPNRALHHRVGKCCEGTMAI